MFVDGDHHQIISLLFFFYCIPIGIYRVVFEYTLFECEKYPFLVKMLKKN